jgi:PAS domain S-box-containing protein
MKSVSSVDIKERKKVEEELRLLSQYAQDAIIQMNSDGLITYWNKSAERLFGYTEKEVLSKNLHSLLAPQRYHKAHKIGFSKFKKSGQGAAINKTLELEGIKKDSAEFPIELSLSAVQIKGEWNAIGIIRDISKRKKIEQKLRDSEEKLRTLFDNINDAIYILDLKGNFINVNATACKRLGYEKREFLQMHIHDINAPELIAENPQLIDEKLWIVKDIVETVHVAKNGKKIPVEIYGKQSLYQNEPAIIAVSRDITRRKITEKQLKESEKKYKILSKELELILDNIPALIFYKDTKNNFIRVNQYIADAHNMKKKELIGRSLFEIYPKDQAQAYWDDDLEVITSGKSKLNIEEPWETKDGLRWLLTSKIPLIDVNGDVARIIVTSIDITERKKGESLKRIFTEKLEKEVQYRTKELNDALEKQKLYLDQIEKSSRFKTEFLATMSHELRTPLNAIIGFTDLLLEGIFGKLNEEQLEYIKDIDESSNHLLDMITNILDISRIESSQVTINIEKIQLNNLIDNVISTLRPLYNEKGLIIDLKGLKKEQLIFADRIKFKQIIYNLLSNAIKFTEKGKVTFEFRDSKDMWEFIVKDTGIGIAEKDFNIIFKEFKRVKSAYVDSIPGSGLGLALTKRIVNLHGGDILFTSKLGKGTAFTFTIPKNLSSKVNLEKIVKSFLSKL